MAVEKLTEITDHLTRKAKRKRNPVPWFVFIGVGLCIFVFFVFPKYKAYAELKNEVDVFVNTVPRLEDEKNKLLAINNELKIEFEKESKPHLVKEDQLFPKVISTSRVARVLEIYALQLDLISAATVNAGFELEKIAFGKRTRMKGRSYTFSEANLSLLTNGDNLKEFIWFLQSGELSPLFVQAKASNILNPTDYAFLEDNLLPLMNIDQISITEDKKASFEGALKVNLKIKFFSQLVS